MRLFTVNKVLFYLTSFLFINFLVGCTSSDIQSDIFEESSCQLPCWNSIVVGQTSEQDLLGILPNIPSVNKESIGEIESSGSFDKRISFNFGEKDREGQYPGFAFMHIKNKKVYGMEFVGGFDLGIGQLINIFGEPKYISVSYNNNGDFDVNLFFTTNGTIAWLRIEQEDDNITQDNKIIAINIFEPKLFETVVETQSGSLYNWDSFGKLSEKYPPN